MTFIIIIFLNLLNNPSAESVLEYVIAKLNVDDNQSCKIVSMELVMFASMMYSYINTKCDML